MELFRERSAGGTPPAAPKAPAPTKERDVLPEVPSGFCAYARVRCATDQQMYAAATATRRCASPPVPRLATTSRGTPSSARWRPSAARCMTGCGAPRGLVLRRSARKAPRWGAQRHYENEMTVRHTLACAGLPRRSPDRHLCQPTVSYAGLFIGVVLPTTARHLHAGPRSTDGSHFTGMSYAGMCRSLLPRTYTSMHFLLRACQ